MAIKKSNKCSINAREGVEKRDPLTLLVGMQIGIATKERSLEVPYKTKNWATIWSSNPTPGHMPRENSNSKGTYSPIFIATLSVIAKTWKQPKDASTDKWKMRCVYTYWVSWNVHSDFSVTYYGKTWTKFSASTYTHTHTEEYYSFMKIK